MTEIQQTNIALANFIIGEFDKAFESVFGRSDDAANYDVKQQGAEMKTLKITWLDSCSKCGFGDYAEVKTERGIGCYLWNGDQVKWPKCGNHGEIECDSNVAFVNWDEVEEKADTEG